MLSSPGGGGDVDLSGLRGRVFVRPHGTRNAWKRDPRADRRTSEDKLPREIEKLQCCRVAHGQDGVAPQVVCSVHISEFEVAEVDAAPAPGAARPAAVPEALPRTAGPFHHQGARRQSPEPGPPRYVAGQRADE